MKKPQIIYVVIILALASVYLLWTQFFGMQAIDTRGLSSQMIFKKIITSILKDASLIEKPCEEEIAKDIQNAGPYVGPDGPMFSGWHVICAEVPHINTLDAALKIDPYIRKYLRPQSNWIKGGGGWKRTFYIEVANKREFDVQMRFGHPNGDYLQLVFMMSSDELEFESKKPHVPKINKPNPEFLTRFETPFKSFLDPLLKDAEVNLVKCPEEIWVDRVGLDNELVLCGNFNGSLADFRNKFDVAAKGKLENTSEDDPMWKSEDKNTARRFTTDGKKRYVIFEYERKKDYNVQINMWPNSEEMKSLEKQFK
jgi:hypothetical protein